MTRGATTFFHLIALLSAAMVLAVAILMPPSDPPSTFSLPPVSAPDESTDTPEMVMRLVSRGQGVAHAPTLIVHPDGALQAVWYQGSREAGPDVGLFTSRFVDGNWRDPVKIADGDRDREETGRFVHTIGNSAIMRHANGETWLFYVATPLGWSAARIALRRSTDDGQTWSKAKFLYATPFLNISMLVRSPPLMTEDGLVALPAYFEFTHDYPVLLLLDDKGDVVGRQRMNDGAVDGIQPAIVPRADGSAVALLRPTGGMSRNVYITERAAGGTGWSRAAPLALPNPRLPVCSARFPDGAVVMVHNIGKNEWHRLGFLYSRDEGRTWLSLPHRIEGESNSRPVGYCTVRATADGGIELVFSDKKRGRIHHMSANRAWLIRQIANGTPAAF